MGQMTNYDKLTLTVDTDGSITGQDAIDFSSRILLDHFTVILEGVGSKAFAETAVGAAPVQETREHVEEVAEAKSIDPIDWKDALHALLARKHEAGCLITRNMRHFKKFSHIIQPKFPCEL